MDRPTVNPASKALLDFLRSNVLLDYHGNEINKPLHSNGHVSVLAVVGSKFPQRLSSLRFFYPEDVQKTFLRNVIFYKTHRATSQKTAFFIVTAVNTSNATYSRSAHSACVRTLSA
jgi:hypothetical protein